MARTHDWNGSSSVKQINYISNLLDDAGEDWDTFAKEFLEGYDGQGKHELSGAQASDCITELQQRSGKDW